MDVNYKKAIEWYEKAAEQGDARLSLSGFHVQDGQGVDVTTRRRSSGTRRRRSRDKKDAQSNLGVMYEHGRGVDVNYKKAIEWYEKAAEQGPQGSV